MEIKKGKNNNQLPLFVYVQIFFISLMTTILQQKIPKEGISCNKTLTNVFLRGELTLRRPDML